MLPRKLQTMCPAQELSSSALMMSHPSCRFEWSTSSLLPLEAAGCSGCEERLAPAGGRERERDIYLIIDFYVCDVGPTQEG